MPSAARRNAGRRHHGLFNYGVPSIAQTPKDNSSADLTTGADICTEVIASLQATQRTAAMILPAGTGLSINVPTGASGTHDAYTTIDSATDTNLGVTSVRADAGIAQAGTAGLLANDLGGPNDALRVTGVHFGATGTDAPVDLTNGATVTGTYGTLFVKQDGTYTFTPNAAFDNLPVGTSASDLFTYTVTDGAGHSATATLTLNEAAANTAPVIEPAGTTASGRASAATDGPNLVSNGDFENDLGNWSYFGNVSTGGGGVGSSSSAEFFPGNPDASLNYGLQLDAGSWYQVTYSVANNDPGAHQASLSVTWSPYNQAPSFQAQSTLQPGQGYTTTSIMVPGYALGSLKFAADLPDGAPPVHLDNVSVQQIVETQSSTLSGAVAFNDPDDAPVAAFTPDGTGYLGTFALGAVARDGTSGDGTVGWTFNLDDWNSIRYLAAGQSITQSYDVTLTDDRNSVAHQTVTVTLNGANDVPVIAGLAQGSITDEQTIHPFATATISDPDRTDIEQVTLKFKTGLGTLSNPGSGSLDGATGTYTTSGSAASVTADLRGLLFTPTANLAIDYSNVDKNGLYGAHFQLSVTDGTATVSATTDDQITPVNNVPAITSAPATGSLDLRTAAPAVSNLLANGSFETGDLTGWTLASLQSAPAPSVAADNPHDGSYAFDFASGTNGDVTLSQTVAVQPSLAYELSWWSDNNSATVQQGNGHNALYTAGQVRAVATDARGYTHYVQELFDAATGNAAVTSTPVSVSVTKATSSDNRVTHVDGISLQPVSFTATTSGTIAFTDPDPLSGPNVGGLNSRDSATATARGSGYLGSLSFDYSDIADGNIGWTFSLSSGDAASLAAGQTLTQAYDVAIGDDQVAPATTSVTVTITGANDAPSLTNHSAPSTVGPSAGLTVATADRGLLAGATDPDPGDAALLKVVSASAAGVSGTTPLISGNASVAGPYGTLTLHDDGTYAYASDPAKLTGVDRHQMVHETFYYTAADPHGATSTAALTIQVLPHQAPVVTARTARADMAQPLTVAAANGLLSGTTDPDGDHPKVSAVSVTTSDGVTHSADVSGPTTIDGVYGTLSVHSDGSYTYTPRGNAVAAGQHATETFGFTVDDGWSVAGGDPTSTLSIDVTNDPVQVAPPPGGGGSTPPNPVPPGSQSGGSATSLTTTTDPSAAQSSAEQAVQTLPASVDKATVTDEVAGFLAGVPAGTPINVSTFTPTPGATNIAIDGPTDGTQTLVILDASNVPPGTPITLNNVSFVVLSGPASLVGGDGSQVVFGDDAAQSMVLGADDDTLHGGGGNDYVGSHGGNDVLYGDAGNDTVSGGIGNDTVSGGADNDLVYGNQDNDVVYGNQGADTLFGGQGTDRAYGGTGADLAYGNKGADVVYGNAGADTLYGGAGADTVYGGAGNDIALGGIGADVLYGNAGADLIYGNAGADSLFGGDGNDVLYGGQGADTLAGGAGDDTLLGGRGADVYVFGANSGRDIILGFSQAEGDRLSLGGQSYTASDDGQGGTLLALSGGGTVDLAGVAQARVTPAAFA